MKMPPQVVPDNLKFAFSWFCAGAGTLLPGYSFFTTYPPPIFPGISILTSVLSAAIIYIILNIKSGVATGKANATHLIRWASFLLLASFFSLVVYIVLIRYCTVLEPQSYAQRFQIGFWKFDWSLTEAGLLLKQQEPLAPLHDWMLRESAFTQGGPEIIWQAWSVTLAGCVLVLTYMVCFVLWAAGFSLLVKHYQESLACRNNARS